MADGSEHPGEHEYTNSEKVKLFLVGKTIKKVIVVPKKLVNIVMG